MAEVPFVCLERILLGGAARPQKPAYQPKSELSNGNIKVPADVPVEKKEKVKAANVVSLPKADEILDIPHKVILIG